MTALASGLCLVGVVIRAVLWGLRVLGHAGSMRSMVARWASAASQSWWCRARAVLVLVASVVGRAVCLAVLFLAWLVFVARYARLVSLVDSVGASAST